MTLVRNAMLIISHLSQTIRRKSEVGLWHRSLIEWVAVRKMLLLSLRFFSFASSRIYGYGIWAPCTRVLPIFWIDQSIVHLISIEFILCNSKRLFVFLLKYKWHRGVQAYTNWMIFFCNVQQRKKKITTEKRFDNSIRHWCIVRKIHRNCTWIGWCQRPIPHWIWHGQQKFVTI